MTEPCAICSGTGWHSPAPTSRLEPCAACGGAGFENALAPASSPGPVDDSCPLCHGTGAIPSVDGEGEDVCGGCCGSGRLDHAEGSSVSMDIPDLFHLGFDLNDAIAKAEQIGHLGLCVIKTGVLAGSGPGQGRPIMFVVAVGDGVDALHKTMSMGGHRILPQDPPTGSNQDPPQDQPPIHPKPNPGDHGADWNDT